MANYYAAARTNYFKVKSEMDFRAWAERIGGEVVTDAEGRFGLLFDESGVPSSIEDEKGDFVDFDLAKELSKHLARGEVAVIVEAGAEKLRYINGYAVAVNDRGNMDSINLMEIYKKAQRLTRKDRKITRAEY